MNADSQIGGMSVETIPQMVTAEEIPIRHCENCNVSLGRVRNKKFCTTACRVSAHRKRNEAAVTID